MTWIFACHQHAAGRSTNWGTAVMLGKPHSLFCHPIEIGCFYFGLSIRPKFTIAQVVCIDVNDVWSLLGIRHCLQEKAKQQNCKFTTGYGDGNPILL
jgi:hypothetical protein